MPDRFLLMTAGLRLLFANQFQTVIGRMYVCRKDAVKFLVSRQQMRNVSDVGLLCPDPFKKSKTLLQGRVGVVRPHLDATEGNYVKVTEFLELVVIYD